MFVLHRLWCRFYVREMIWLPNRLLVGWLIYWGSFNRLYHLLPLLQPGHPCSLSSSLHFSPSYHPSSFGSSPSEDACLLSWDVIVTFSEAALSGQIHSFGIFGVSFFEAAVSGSCFMIVESILGFASQDLSKALLQRQSSVELVG